jgi:hypothetical protein
MWIAKLLLDNYASLKNYYWGVTVLPEDMYWEITERNFPTNIVALPFHATMETIIKLLV